MKNFPLTLLFLLLASVVRAETLYVCHGGNGSAPTVATCAGAWSETNFNDSGNWGVGASKISAGDTVELMADGGNLSQLAPRASGSSGSVVTIQNQSGDNAVISNSAEHVVLFSGSFTVNYLTMKKNPGGGSLTITMSGNPTGSYKAGLILNAANHHITLDGLVFQGQSLQSANAFGLWLATANDDILVQNCEFLNWRDAIYSEAGGQDRLTFDNISSHNNGSSALVNGNGITFVSDQALPYRTQIVIKNSDFYLNAREGIQIGNVDGFDVLNNNCYQNGASGIQVEIFAFNGRVKGNTCYQNSAASVYPNEGGIWIDESQDIVVENNICWGQAFGITVSESRRVIVRNNVTYDNNRTVPGGTGQIFAALRLSSKTSGHMASFGDHYYAYNNTSDKDGYAGTTFGIQGGISPGYYINASDTHTSTTFIKNMVMHNVANVKEVYEASGFTSSTFEGNYYYNSSRTVAFYSNGSNQTAAQWETDHPLDHATGTSSPAFVSTASHNYSILTSSPLKNLGEKLTTVSSTNGTTTITAADPHYFYDGNGITGVTGDKIAVFSNAWTLRGTATLTDVNYTTGVLTMGTVPGGTTGGDFLVFATDFLGNTLTDRPEIGAYWFQGNPPAGTITITYPTAGQSFFPAQSITYTWQTSDVPGSLLIEYSIDGGTNWIELIAGAFNDGFNAWTIPAVSSSNVVLRITEEGGSGATDTSEVFSINPPAPSGSGFLILRAN